MNRRRRGPVTDDEALAALQGTIEANNERRIARHEQNTGRDRSDFTSEDWEAIGPRDVPQVLPDVDDLDARDLFSFRISTALLARVRARAALEDHRGISSVIIEAFTAYADHEPGTAFTMDFPQMPDSAATPDDGRTDEEV